MKANQLTAKGHHFLLGLTILIILVTAGTMASAAQVKAQMIIPGSAGIALGNSVVPSSDPILPFGQTAEITAGIPFHTIEHHDDQSHEEDQYETAEDDFVESTETREEN